MSWFSENKFIAVFGGATLVLAGALGYLGMGASSDASQAEQEYEAAKSELSSLQNNNPSFTPQNVEETRARQKSFKEQITALQAELATMEIKLEPNIAPTVFQDRLSEAVRRVTTKGAEMETTFAETKFYLGFPEYQGAPPREAAAPVLLRQLRAIEIVVNMLLEVKGVEIKKITRTELDEEKRAVEPPRNQPGRPVKTPGRPEEQKKLVQKASFQIEFATNQDHFSRVLNGIASNKEQFLIVRNVIVKNEKLTAPSKAAVVENDPNRPKREAIFGREKLMVTLEIDIVDFADPEAEKAGAKKLN